MEEMEMMMGIILGVISQSDAGEIKALRTIHDIRQTPTSLLYDDSTEPSRGDAD
jgi:hypothetical protein